MKKKVASLKTNNGQKANGKKQSYLVNYMRGYFGHTFWLVVSELVVELNKSIVRWFKSTSYALVGGRKKRHNLLIFFLYFLN